MSGTIVVIPSRGRASALHTYNAIKAECPFPIFVIISAADDWDAYAAAAPEATVYRHRKTWPNIGAKRQWIMGWTTSRKVLMMDDDLVSFSVRRSDDPSKARRLAPGDIDAMFRAWDRALDTYAHAGILTRGGFNQKPDADIIPLQRMNATIGYDVKKFREAGARFDRVCPMEDFDVTLQLIAKGHPNALLGRYLWDAGPNNAPGGCYAEDRLKKQEAAAKELARLHAPFVQTVQKTTKGAWGGATRTDVRIAWQKAAKAAGIEL